MSSGARYSKDYIDGSGNVVRQARWDYDYTPGTTATQGYSLSRLTRSSDSASQASEQFFYDELGRTTQEEQCVDGNRCYTSAAAYDMAGRLLTLTYPDEDTGQLSSGSETVSYTYDALGRLVSVPGYATALQYTSDGQIKQMSYTNGGHDDLHLRPAAALAHRHPRL